MVFEFGSELLDMAVGRLRGQVSERREHALDQARLTTAVVRLMERSLEDDPSNPYIVHHSQPACVAGHVKTFCRYAPFLPDRGDVLDWGCHHAPDSCLLRTAYPNRFRLHGCDHVEPQRFARFHEYAALDYRQLSETVATPYAPDSFEAVIGSGVLEHVAMDYESLKELHRILKPGGVLIITYLPNWLSWREWVHRVIRKRGFHQRRYGLAEAQTLLKRAGFLPELAEHANYAHPALGPLKFLCSTLTLVARKVHAM